MQQCTIKDKTVMRLNLIRRLNEKKEENAVYKNTALF